MLYTGYVKLVYSGGVVLGCGYNVTLLVYSGGCVVLLVVMTRCEYGVCGSGAWFWYGSRCPCVGCVKLVYSGGVVCFWMECGSCVWWCCGMRWCDVVAVVVVCSVSDVLFFRGSWIGF